MNQQQDDGNYRTSDLYYAAYLKVAGCLLKGRAVAAYWLDVHDRETRSYNMSRIKGSDTKPEMVVRRECHRQGQSRDLSKGERVEVGREATLSYAEPF